VDLDYITEEYAEFFKKSNNYLLQKKLSLSGESKQLRTGEKDRYCMYYPVGLNIKHPFSTEELLS
jgi:hypothetical protein